jgi:PPIC-type PPIASE domain
VNSTSSLWVPKLRCSPSRTKDRSVKIISKLQSRQLLGSCDLSSVGLAVWLIVERTSKSMSSSSSQVRAAHLLIKHRGSRNPVSRRTGNSVTLSDTDAIQELGEYERKIRAEGLEGFPRYASERSDCSSYAKGGDLGFFGPGTVSEVCASRSDRNAAHMISHRPRNDATTLRRGILFVETRGNELDCSDGLWLSSRLSHRLRTPLM